MQLILLKQFHAIELRNLDLEPLYPTPYLCCINSPDIINDICLASRTIMSLCLSLARSTVSFKTIIAYLCTFTLVMYVVVLFTLSGPPAAGLLHRKQLSSLKPIALRCERVFTDGNLSHHFVAVF